MIIDFSELSKGQIYHAMTQTVIPRPVAWVLSDNGDQSYNLAPFSYFNAVCSDPPLIMLSIGKKPDGSIKDSRHNILERSHFVVHIPHREQAQQVTDSSATLPFGESELATLGLATVSFGDFALPRLENCRIAMACERHQVVELGSTPQAVIFAEVKSLYVADDCAEFADGRLRVLAEQVDPLARLGADDYMLAGATITIPRPK